MTVNFDLDLETIIRTFAAECAERITDMEQAAIALEMQPKDEAFLEAIFRGAHTIKGNAGSLGYASLAEFTHGMEDFLQRLRSGATPVTQRAVTLMLQSVDVLRELIEEAVEGTDLLKPHHAELLTRLADDDLDIGQHPPDNGTQNTQQLAPEKNSPNLITSRARRAEVSVVAERNGTIRVDIQKLDRMLNLAGEITIAQGRLRQALGGKKFAKDAFEAHELLERLSLDLQENIMKLRMVPIGLIFRHFVRVARDVAVAAGKEARLLMEGEEAEIDLGIVEHLKDPLMHMVRNAIDHGIEAPDTRRKLGKDSCGLLLLRALHDSGNIVIQLIDDGAGLNRELIIARAKEHTRVTNVEKMSDREIYQLIFEPGFSTASAVTDLSGRGVGMDVVKRNIDWLRGTVQVESEAGRGVTVTMRLPLTLAIIEGFSVNVGDDTYILPLHEVRECLILPPEERASGGSGVIDLRGEPLPYIRLRDRFKIDAPPALRENIVVVSGNGVKAGLAVDALNGPRQTVIKPLSKRFQRVPGISGSAILENGRVALIVDIAGLLRDVMHSTVAEDRVTALPLTEEL